MRKAPVLATVIVLLVSAIAPLASAQDGEGHGPVTDGELAAFAQGYVENLVLWSGAGIDLAHGASFGGDPALLAQRIAELETAVMGTMPENATPILAPWTTPNPAYGAEAPIDHSANWTWNSTGVETTVASAGVGTLIGAEAALAARLLEGDRDGKLGATPEGGAEGVLLVLAALEAVDFVVANLGWNGSAMVPLNLSDMNMTDMDPSNGWWLPAGTVTGDLNTSVAPPSWGPTSATDPSIVTTVRLLKGLAQLYGTLMDTTGLMGDGEVFPASAGDHVRDVISAIYWNLLARYYDYMNDAFHDGAGNLNTATLSMVLDTLDTLADSLEGVPAGDSAADYRDRVAWLMLRMQLEDGSLPSGYTVGPTGVTFNTGDAGVAGTSRAITALYSVHESIGGVVFGAAARAAYRSMDAAYWSSAHHVYIPTPDEPNATHALWQFASEVDAVIHASEVGGVELAKHRLAQLWGSVVASGLQLGETDTTGEDYSVAGNDTDGDGLLKHNVSRGEGREFGVAPMLAINTAFNNTTGNWTPSYASINAMMNMEVAAKMMHLDADWAVEHGTPASSESNAFMLLHWSEAEISAWMEERAADVAALEANISALQDEVAAAMAEADSIRENITRLELDLNDSRENETVLNTSVNWLRQKLEDTNGTVENLTKDIDVLNDRIKRLEEDLGYKDENVTKLKSELRSERFNVTKLNWTLANASIDLANAIRDKEAAEADLEEAQDKLDDQEGRAVTTSVVAFIVGLVLGLGVMLLLARMRKAKQE